MSFKQLLYILLFFFTVSAKGSFILIPMDETTQQNHLKAYGITYWALDKQYKISWLLNYRGGSFLLPDAQEIRKECQIRGVSFEVLSDGESNSILDEISSPSQNMEAVVLERTPKIAVYTPKGKQPWDDAVTLVLTYAEIPFTPVYDEEVLSDGLLLYDWLHLHHEDFTGQYGKFFGAYKNAPWYIEQKKNAEALAAKLGYGKVSESKLA
ncbi:MAG: asparagine synthetase B, partial [Chitinophagaceae bacterium]